MKLADFLTLTTFLALCSCGDGGVSLDTDNVKGEYYPKGSRTAFLLEDEITAPAAPNAAEEPSMAGIKLNYVSYGNNQGSLSIDGQPEELATLSSEAEQIITFTTPSATIRLAVTPTGEQNAAITEWTYATGQADTPRRGTAGVTQTTESK